MSLKTDAILLQYTFHQFQYIMTTCLCTVETNQQVFQSNRFNGKKKGGMFHHNKLPYSYYTCIRKQCQSGHFS